MYKRFTKSAIVAVALVGVVATSVQAQKVMRQPYAGCISKDAMSEMISASSARNYDHMNQLMASGLCYNLQGVSYNLVERGFIRSKIRTHYGLLYVPTEATR